MNERLLALSNQAMVERTSGFKEFDAEKFAELIVRECIATVESDKYAKDNQSWSKAMLYSASLIKKHFGVEE